MSSRLGKLRDKAKRLSGEGSCQGCGSSFSLLNHKHSCKHCRGDFCKDCLSQRVTLSGVGTERVCNSCHSQITSTQSASGGRGPTAGGDDRTRPGLGLPAQGSKLLPGLNSMGSVPSIALPSGPLSSSGIAGGQQQAPPSNWHMESIGSGAVSTNRYGIHSDAELALGPTHEAVSGGAGPGYGGKMSNTAFGGQYGLLHATCAGASGGAVNVPQYGSAVPMRQGVGHPGGDTSTFLPSAFPSPAVGAGSKVARTDGVAAAGAMGMRANPERMRELEELKSELARASETAERLRRQGRLVDSMQHARYIKDLQTNMQVVESKLYEDDVKGDGRVGGFNAVGFGYTGSATSMDAPGFGQVLSASVDSTRFGHMDSAFHSIASGLGRMGNSTSVPAALFEGSQNAAGGGLGHMLSASSRPTGEFGRMESGVSSATNVGFEGRIVSDSSVAASQWVNATEGGAPSAHTMAGVRFTDSAPSVATSGLERISSVGSTAGVGFGRMDSGAPSAAHTGLGHLASGASLPVARYQLTGSATGSAASMFVRPDGVSSVALIGLDRMSSTSSMAWNEQLGKSSDQQGGMMGRGGSGSIAASSTITAGLGRADSVASVAIPGSGHTSSVSSTAWHVQPEKGGEGEGGLADGDGFGASAGGTSVTVTGWGHAGNGEFGRTGSAASVALTGFVGDARASMGWSSKLEESDASGLGANPGKEKAMGGTVGDEFADLVEWGAASAGRESSIGEVSASNVSGSEGVHLGPRLEDGENGESHSQENQAMPVSTGAEVVVMGATEEKSSFWQSPPGAPVTTVTPAGKPAAVTTEEAVANKVAAAGGTASGGAGGGGGEMGEGGVVGGGIVKGREGAKPGLSAKLAQLEEERQACKKRAAAFRKEGKTAQWKEETKKAKELEKKMEDMEILGGDDEDDDDDDEDLEVLLGLRKPTGCKNKRKAGGDGASGNLRRAKMLGEVKALKKDALALKREGKLAEAKASLRDAKIKEKEIEEKDLIAAWESSEESDEDDEAANLEVLLGMRPPKGGKSRQDYALKIGNLSPDLGEMDSLANIGMGTTTGGKFNVSAKFDLSALGLGNLGEPDADAVDVDDSDLHDPQIAALLREVGWKEEASDLPGIKSGEREHPAPPSQVGVSDRSTLIREALECKRRAQALRKQGRTSEADNELVRASSIEARVKGLESGAAGYKTTTPVRRQPLVRVATSDHYPPLRDDVLAVTNAQEDYHGSQEVTEEDEQNPEYLEALKKMGWEGDDNDAAMAASKASVHGQVGDMAVEENSGSSSLPASVLQLKQDVISHKRRSFHLKREGKIAEAKEVLKAAKIMEKRIEQLKASDRETDSKSTPSRSVSQAASCGPGGSVASIWGEHEGDPDVTEEDEKDPEIIAMLKSIGWSFEEDKTVKGQAAGQKVKADLRRPHIPGSIHNVSVLKQEALNHKRQAMSLKKEGKIAEAKEALKMARTIEKRITELEAQAASVDSVSGGDAAMWGEHGGDPDVMEEDEQDPEMIVMLESVGWSFEEGKTEKRQAAGQKVKGDVRTPQVIRSSHDVSALRQQAVGHKRRALVLKREGKIDEAKEELKMAKAIEKRVEELEALNPEASGAELSMMTPLQQGLTGSYAAGLDMPTSGTIGNRDEVTTTEEVELDPEITAMLKSHDVFTMKQEALHHKRKSMALRKERKLGEADEEFRIAKVIEKRIEELQSPSVVTCALERLSHAAVLSTLHDQAHRTIVVKEVGQDAGVEDTNRDSICDDVTSLRKEVVMHKQRAVALKKGGNITEAKEELKVAKLLEKRIGELQALTTVGGQQRYPPDVYDEERKKLALTAVTHRSVASSIDVDEIQKGPVGGEKVGDPTKEQRVSLDTAILKQEALSHKRRALALKKEGKIQEAKEELKAAKAVEVKIQEWETLNLEAMTQLLQSNDCGACAEQHQSLDVLESDERSTENQPPSSGAGSNDEADKIQKMQLIVEKEATEELPQGIQDVPTGSEEMDLRKKILVHEESALSLMREKRFAEAQEELLKATVLQQRIEELRRAVTPAPAQACEIKGSDQVLIIQETILAIPTGAEALPSAPSTMSQSPSEKMAEAPYDTSSAEASTEPAISAASHCEERKAAGSKEASHDVELLENMGTVPSSASGDPEVKLAAIAEGEVGNGFPQAGSHDKDEDDLSLALEALEEEALEAKRQERKLWKLGKVEEANEELRKRGEIEKKIIEIETKMQRPKSGSVQAVKDLPGLPAHEVCPQAIVLHMSAENYDKLSHQDKLLADFGGQQDQQIGGISSSAKSERSSSASVADDPLGSDKQDDHESQAPAGSDNTVEAQNVMVHLENRREGSMQGEQIVVDRQVEEAARPENASSPVEGAVGAPVNHLDLSGDCCDNVEDRGAKEGSIELGHSNASTGVAGMKQEAVEGIRQTMAEGLVSLNKNANMEEELWQQVTYHERRSMVLRTEGKIQEAASEARVAARVRQQIEALLLGEVTVDGGKEESVKGTPLSTEALQTESMKEAKERVDDALAGFQVLSVTMDAAVAADAAGKELRETVEDGSGVSAAISASEVAEGRQPGWAATISSPWRGEGKEQYLKWLQDDLLEIERTALALEGQGRKEEALEEWRKGHAIEKRIRELKASSLNQSDQGGKSRNRRGDAPLEPGAGSLSEMLTSTQTLGDAGKEEDGVPLTFLPTSDKRLGGVVDGAGEIDAQDYSQSGKRRSGEQRISELEFLEQEKKRLSHETLKLRREKKTREAEIEYAKFQEVKAQIQILKDQDKTPARPSEAELSAAVYGDAARKYEDEVLPAMVGGGVDGEGEVDAQEAGHRKHRGSELEFLEQEKKHLVRQTVILRREGKLREAKAEYAKLQNIKMRIQTLMEQEKSPGNSSHPASQKAPPRPLSPRQPSQLPGSFEAAAQVSCSVSPIQPMQPLSQGASWGVRPPDAGHSSQSKPSRSPLRSGKLTDESSQHLPHSSSPARPSGSPGRSSWELAPPGVPLPPRSKQCAIPLKAGEGTEGSGPKPPTPPPGGWRQDSLGLVMPPPPPPPPQTGRGKPDWRQDSLGLPVPPPPGPRPRPATSSQQSDSNSQRRQSWWGGCRNDQS